MPLYTSSHSVYDQLQGVNVLVEDTDKWITTSGTGKVNQAKRNVQNTQ